MARTTGTEITMRLRMVGEGNSNIHHVESPPCATLSFSMNDVRKRPNPFACVVQTEH